jgi:hypothetical protein
MNLSILTQEKVIGSSTLLASQNWHTFEGVRTTLLNFSASCSSDSQKSTEDRRILLFYQGKEEHRLFAFVKDFQTDH